MSGDQNNMQPAADGKSIGFAILSFFIPLIGIILFFVWKAQTPLKAKSCLKGAIIGVIVYVVFVIISTIISACAMAAYM